MELTKEAKMKIIEGIKSFAKARYTEPATKMLGTGAKKNKAQHLWDRTTRLQKDLAIGGGAAAVGMGGMSMMSGNEEEKQASMKSKALELLNKVKSKGGVVKDTIKNTYYPVSDMLFMAGTAGVAGVGAGALLTKNKKKENKVIKTGGLIMNKAEVVFNKLAKAKLKTRDKVVAGVTAAGAAAGFKAAKGGGVKGRLLGAAAGTFVAGGSSMLASTIK